MDRITGTMNVLINHPENKQSVIQAYFQLLHAADTQKSLLQGRTHWHYLDHSQLWNDAVNQKDLSLKWYCNNIQPVSVHTYTYSNCRNDLCIKPSCSSFGVKLQRGPEHVSPEACCDQQYQELCVNSLFTFHKATPRYFAANWHVPFYSMLFSKHPFCPAGW